MTQVVFPYGATQLSCDFSDDELKGVLVSRIEDYTPCASGSILVEEALEQPISSPPLHELAKGKDNVVILASDHTRPVPSKIILPAMLNEIRRGNPDARITILIATGFHRGTTKDELVEKFGSDIVAAENIVIHDCNDSSQLVDIGILPSGGRCILNKRAVEADLLLAEGFIEPHFFAGFSGGRKSLLPGVASRETVLANHCADFIASPCARAGILEGNPIHEDMLWAAREAHVDFIVNVVINAHKEIVFAVAGDVEDAHKAGRDFLMQYCGVKAIPCDIAVTSNGGYPLDQDIYQAVKGMTAAEATVRAGGVIIMIAESVNGHGGVGFYDTLTSSSDIKEIEKDILRRSAQQTLPDQWETQIFLRVLQHAQVIYVSSQPDELIRALHMHPARTIDDALCIARELIGKEHAEIVAIPDGVGVVVHR